MPDNRFVSAMAFGLAVVAPMTRAACLIVLVLFLLGALAANAAPPPTFWVSVAFDDRRARLVVFAGTDTWEWDGASWLRVATTGPSDRAAAAMIYDPRREKILLFGGLSPQGSSLGDTWEWDGTRWTQVASTGPSPRWNTAMTYDRARGRAVLFGGVHTDLPESDTWEWNGSQWQQVAVTGPPARFSAGIAYDELRGVTLLFGGNHNHTQTGQIGDMWIFDGTTWTEIATSGPSPRDHVSMTYDVTLKRIVMFGGPQGPSSTEGWEWSGTEWHPLTATGPGSHSSPLLVTDRNGGRVLMYGGFAEAALNELWILSCDQWSLARP